jgi:hypothetical protein
MIHRHLGTKATIAQVGPIAYLVPLQTSTDAHDIGQPVRHRSYRQGECFSVPSAKTTRGPFSSSKGSATRRSDSNPFSSRDRYQSKDATFAYEQISMPDPLSRSIKRTFGIVAKIDIWQLGKWLKWSPSFKTVVLDKAPGVTRKRHHIRQPVASQIGVSVLLPSS